MKKLFYQSPRWSGEILDCSMPMTFDTYSRCSYNCMYCFSYFQKSLKEFNPAMINQTKTYTEMGASNVEVEWIKSLFLLKRQTQFSEYICRKITFQWGGLADPFDEYERQKGVTLELLKFFDKIDYPICFSTKATWWTEDERYLRLFRKHKNWNVKVSIINLDVAKARVIEQGCPSPAERLKAIARVARSVPGGLTLRLRPFIIGMSNIDYLDLIKEASSAGVKAVSTEFFCLEGRIHPGLQKRYDVISNSLGMDIVDFYKKNSPRQSGYLRLNWKIKEPYIDKMENLCNKLKLRFYVSDAHHKDRCANGSCCGLGEGWNYQRGQFTAMLCLAKNRPDGLVYWEDMEKEIGELFNFLWRKSLGYNTIGSRARCFRWNQTMKEYIQECWNDPSSKKSPYQYFEGLLRPVRLDKNNNVIYKYYKYES